MLWLLLQEGKGKGHRLQGQLAPGPPRQTPVWCLWRRLQRAALPGRPCERQRSVINKGIDFPISALCILLANALPCNHSAPRWLAMNLKCRGT